MKKYILTIDQGTSSTRAMIFDNEGNLSYIAAQEINSKYRKSGYVEQDGLAIWASVVAVVNEVLIKANITMEHIAAIGVTNQRETTLVWDKETGIPIYDAIVWQSTQSSNICERYEEQSDLIKSKTGLHINPYFSASKIRYILEKVPGAQKRAENGELYFGTVDTWLIYKMSKGKVHATDASNASRTMLYNIFEQKWDEELLELFDIPAVMLPEVKNSSCDFGKATFFHPDVSITGVAGDQQASLFGQTCFKPGDAKNTYGTGCFMLMNTGETPVVSKKGLLTTIAWQIDNKVTYALEGSVFIGGAAVQWLRDELNLITNAAESEYLANKVVSSEGVYVIPSFTGLSAPYWDSDARGAIFGLTRGSNKYHLIRATLEAIAYQSKDVIEVMKEETGLSFNSLKVDGGASNNNYLMQFQSDILHSTIKRPAIFETTSLGVAYLAGLYVGFYKNLDDVKSRHIYAKEFYPTMEQSEVDTRYEGWKQAIASTRKFKLEE